MEQEAMACEVPSLSGKKAALLHRVKTNGPVPPPENPRAAPLICRLPLKGGVIVGDASQPVIPACFKQETRIRGGLGTPFFRNNFEMGAPRRRERRVRRATLIVLPFLLAGAESRRVRYAYPGGPYRPVLG